MNQEIKTMNKYSLAFDYFKRGKTPLDVVMDGILKPDEAQRLYGKFLELSKLKTPTPEELSYELKKPEYSYSKPRDGIELTIDEWKEAFRGFSRGMHPVEIVIEKNIDPEKVEYAYAKFLELNDKYVTLTDHEWSIRYHRVFYAIKFVGQDSDIADTFETNTQPTGTSSPTAQTSDTYQQSIDSDNNEVPDTLPADVTPCGIA